MKNIFGVEWFNKQEDFEEALEKVKALLKDGDESTIVYIASESEKCHEVIAKGVFEARPGSTKLYPIIVYNEELLTLLRLSTKTNKKEKLLTA